MLPDQNSLGPRLVYSRKPNRVDPKALVRKETGPQASLFAEPKPGVVVFVEVAWITDSEFVRLVNDVEPSVIFDLRVVPRFDLGRLNRKGAFTLFEKVGSRYVDASIPLMTGTKSDSALASLQEMIAGTGLARPLLFLFGTGGSSIVSSDEVLGMLQAAGSADVKLELLSLPM